MSKTWYPVINYEGCNECGACFNKCTNDVFALKNTRPVVVNPQTVSRDVKDAVLFALQEQSNILVTQQMAAAAVQVAVTVKQKVYGGFNYE
ncbi:hypothetical protein LPY66_04375 [Dehalobacter sp. DCM]|uniref:4Fe-4S dicluster domain-containing protein n=1 Tax=Dehalobacter sp. DCM TaxID=2907827 RepID=UPI0030814919|nr:hypothetical protein LPY66_04375 [Dehalobacter sp. DCM]